MIENGEIDEDLSLYFFQRYMKIVTGKADRAIKLLVKLLATSSLLESSQKMPLLSILMVGKKFGSMKELTKMATESVRFFQNFKVNFFEICMLSETRALGRILSDRRLF